MTRIAFVAAAMLVAAMGGDASAGSDHYGADGANQPTAGVDQAPTASIPMRDVAHHQAQVTTATGETVADIIARHNDDSLWGR